MVMPTAPLNIGEAEHKQLLEFSTTLMSENEITNLTGAKSADEFMKKHVCDAVLAWQALDRALPKLSRAEHHWDVGSGNGVPGIIVAILSEESRVTLVERREKKAAALLRVVSSLNLNERVDVVCQTFEQINPGPERRDTVWMRGFLPGPKLITYLSQNFKANDLGPIVLMKGPAWESERDEALRTTKIDRDWKSKFSNCANHPYEEKEHLGRRSLAILN